MASTSPGVERVGRVKSIERVWTLVRSVRERTRRGAESIQGFSGMAAYKKSYLRMAYLMVLPEGTRSRSVRRSKSRRWKRKLHLFQRETHLIAAILRGFRAILKSRSKSFGSLMTKSW